MSISEAMSLWYLPEILSHVCSFAHCSDYAALCRTSKHIYGVGLRFLYDSIDLDVPNKHAESLFLLCRTLEKKPILALRIKSLRLQLCVSSVCSDSGDSDDSNDSNDSTIIHQSPLLPRMLDLCTNLKAISITHPYPVSDPVAQEINRSLSRLQHLQELEFNTPDTNWPSHIPGETDVNVSLLAQALSIGSLDSISLTLQQGPGSLLPTTTMAMPPTSNITRLSLNRAYLSMESLDSMMRALLHLKHLSLSFLWYADPINPQVGQHLDCGKLGQALAHRSSTLESLEIAVQFESRCALEVERGSAPYSAWGLRHSIGSLRSFTHLASLQLAPEVLLGWEGERALPLSDLLPGSLRHLHFRWDFGAWEQSPWEYEALCESLADYLDSSPSHLLENLVLTCFDDEVSELEVPFESIRSRCEERQIRSRFETISL